MTAKSLASIAAIIRGKILPGQIPANLRKQAGKTNPDEEPAQEWGQWLEKATPKEILAAIKKNVLPYQANGRMDTDNYQSLTHAGRLNCETVTKYATNLEENVLDALFKKYPGFQNRTLSGNPESLRDNARLAKATTTWMTTGDRPQRWGVFAEAFAYLAAKGHINAQMEGIQKAIRRAEQGKSNGETPYYLLLVPGITAQQRAKIQGALEPQDANHIWKPINEGITIGLLALYENGQEKALITALREHADQGFIHALAIMVLHRKDLMKIPEIQEALRLPLDRVRGNSTPFVLAWLTDPQYSDPTTRLQNLKFIATTSPGAIGAFLRSVEDDKDAGLTGPEIVFLATSPYSAVRLKTLEIAARTRTQQKEMSHGTAK